ncbi:MAG: sensor histidine kinase, partial [Clostridiaceae bacterium]|nr:sensor histidine kinase [Clostridiaceae bacterium]
SYIVLFNDNFSNATNWAAYEKTDREFIDHALQNAELGDGAVSWTTGGGSTSGLFLGRNIRKIEGLDFSTIGRLLIYVDTDRLINTINRSFQTFDTGYYILADGPDTIYASSGLSKDLVNRTLLLEDDTYQTLQADNHTYFAVSSKIPYYDWRYISLIPFDSIIHSIGRSAKIILGIMVLGILTALVLTQWLIYSILRHFNALIVKMDVFSKNELTLEQSAYDYSTRNDEIGRLHQRFDRMATRIRTLVDTNYKNELLRKEAQIKALESQINPHFLYNTLESINWRAKASKNAEISMMAESLGTLLRSTLSNHESLVELDYELELVRAYITIQKIRFEDRLDFLSLVDDDLHHILMPPLTIQPLIENAIRYGMEEMTETCHIELLVRHEGDQVLIRVKNNGSVFEDHLLEKLKSREKQPNGFGIGLMNIDQRIRLLFGDAYGLELNNEDDCATADIHIPFQVKEN